MRRRALALCALGLVASGCSSALEVSAPRPAPSVRALCEVLHAALPSVVDGHKRRNVTPEDPLTAAWGSPAIVLRCGVGEPPIDTTGTHDDVGVNGVDWRPVQDDAGYTFTTIGRRAYVEVRVPKKYAPEVNSLLDLAAAVSRTLPQDSP